MYDFGINYLFTATLSGQKRDTLTTTPKTNFLDIRFQDGSLFRDHCWVTISERFAHLIPKSHKKKKTKIVFQARIEPYQSSEGVKHRIHHIRNIKPIKE